MQFSRCFSREIVRICFILSMKKTHILSIHLQKYSNAFLSITYLHVFVKMLYKLMSQKQGRESYKIVNALVIAIFTMKRVFDQSNERPSNSRNIYDNVNAKEGKQQLAAFVTYSQHQVIYIFLINAIISTGTSQTGERAINFAVHFHTDGGDSQPSMSGSGILLAVRGLSVCSL